MAQKKNLTGVEIGRLKVLYEMPATNTSGIRWMCACDCGNVKSIAGIRIRPDALEKSTLSCGCIQKETIGNARRKHGLSTHPVGMVWNGIVQRCYNPNSEEYHNYGGRGILMCSRYRSSPRYLLDDLGERPTEENGKSYQINRIDNDGGYWCGKERCLECVECHYPSNCEWTTAKLNCNNTQANNFQTAYGRVQTMAQWAEETGIPYATLHQRVTYQKLAMEEAIRRG